MSYPVCQKIKEEGKARKKQPESKSHNQTEVSEGS